jgi:hypothetical protein
MAKIYKVLIELYDLVFTSRKDDRSGRVISTGSLRIDDLINIAVSRRSDISPELMQAVYSLLRSIALEEVLGGKHVEFGLTHLSLGVDGIFIGDHASWDSSKNKLILNSATVVDVREAIKDVEVTVLGMAQSGIYINTLTDIVSEEVNTSITPGGGVNLVGVKIKIAGDDPAVGLYLTEINSETTFTVPKSSFLTNDPSKISFIVPPDLIPGDYKLKIVTQFSGHQSTLKEPRTYVYDYILACNINKKDNESHG